MCGIAGVVQPRAAPEDIDAQLQRMVPGIARRGPDGQGRLVTPGVGLLNTRLAVIDLDGGAQPVWGEDRAVACVFNGEIYNYAGLRASLRERGHVLTTDGDTEVLVHLYEDHGADVVNYVHGMYAVALYDARRQRVLLARDRFGQKPMYLARLPAGGVAFASSIASLLAVGVSADPDETGLAQYFRFYKVPEPRTAYRAISTLLPGHLLEIDVATGEGRTRRFYTPGEGSRSQGTGEGGPPTDGVAAVRKARSAFEAAVASHVTAADVEVGAFLSGGVDSSLVVAHAQRVAQRPLRTFSVSFAGAGAAYDESPYAEAVARQLGTHHDTIRVESPPSELVRRAIDAAHQPFAVASFLPLLVLSEHVSRELKVVLTGDGGDEISFGYPWYRWMSWTAGRSAGHLRRRVDGALRPVELRLSERRELRRLRRATKFARGALLGGAAASDTWRYDVSGAEAIGFLSAELRPEVTDPEQSPTESAWRPELHRADSLRHADVEVLLRDEMLPKLDRAGMAFGLEGRVPLLDDDFAEAMLAVPRALQMRDGSGKAVLRGWARDALPGIDFDRPKHGFDVPIDAWLRASLRPDVDRLLLAPGRRGLVDRDAAMAVWRRMEAGVPGAGHSLYAMLLAELWFEDHL